MSIGTPSSAPESPPTPPLGPPPTGCPPISWLPWVDRPERASAVAQAMREAGYLILAEGGGGTVLSLSPPLNIGADVLEAGLDTLIERLRA